MNPTFPDHFSNVATGYADYRPNYPTELFDYLATLASCDALVWDCAAGSGQATRGLAQRFTHITATDASPEQVAAAPKLPNVDFRVALAEASGLSDASVGLVTVAQALHWFDLRRFYPEVRRVLRPGGVLAVWAYGITRVEAAAVDSIVQDFYANTLGPYWPPSRQIVERGYRTLPFPFAEISPPPFRMECSWTLDRLLGYFSTWSATSRYIKATGQSPIDALQKKLAPVWGGSNEPRTVGWPLALRVGRA